MAFIAKLRAYVRTHPWSRNQPIHLRHNHGI